MWINTETAEGGILEMSQLAGLQQSEGASAQGGRAHDPAPRAQDRSHCYRF